MNWRQRALERVRAVDPLVVDGVLAVVFTVAGIASAYAEDISDDDRYREPTALLVLTAVVISAPIAVRRRWPLMALTTSAIGILVHLLIGWPEGTLPLATLLLTFTVGVWCPLRRAVVGLALLCTTIAVLAIYDVPTFDTAGTFGILANFAAAWALGVAFRNRRAVGDARVREAEERAEAERQRTARVLAEERLRIAQELHDVVAHSMSVIAVQAGAGAHVLDDQPEQARAALDAISATSRGTLAEMRRLLGVLRDSDGVRSSAPAPGITDLPQLIDEVRAAGVPAALQVDGGADGVPAGVELSAYRVVQEALTNVIKHAGSPTRVDVTVRHLPDSLLIEVVDDGRGLAARTGDAGSGTRPDRTGHGLVGMRERVELWGGELVVGPAPGGGYRVKALLPLGDAG